MSEGAKRQRNSAPADSPQEQTSMPVDDSEDMPQPKKAAPEKPKRTRTRSKAATPRRQRAAERDADEEDRGRELERRLGRVEFADGALTRMRVPVRAVGADPGRDVLTDIDVLSIDVDLRLRLTRSISECKSGAGQTGEPDRLFWLAGFRDYLAVDRATLVREAITPRGAILARALGIDLVDAPTLAERETDNAWLPDRFAHVDGTECAAVERRADTQLAAIRAIPPGLVSFLRHGALLADSFESLNAIAAAGDAIEEASVLPDPAGIVVAAHCLTALIGAAVQDASRVGTVSDSVLRERVTLAITTGNPNDTYVLEVLARADDVVRSEVERLHDLYLASGSPRVEFQHASLRAVVAEQPLWIDRYVDFVHRLRASASSARDLLQTAELALFEALPGGKAHRADAFGQLFTREHRSLLLAAVKMMRDIAGNTLADRLEGGIRDLDWDRTAPIIPDRRRSAAVAEPPRAAIAAETPRTQSRDEP
jgi:hypothetical protein